jgi:hypothetical protein
MKRILFTLSILLSLIFNVNAQQILIQGLVHSNNQPASNVDVDVSILWSNSNSQNFMLTTDTDGRFSLSIDQPLPDSFPHGVIVVKMIDCNGNVVVDRQLIRANQSRVSFKLEYCRGEQSRCSVKLRRELGRDSNIYLVAYPLGSAPFEFLWNDGTTTDRLIPVEGRNYCVTITDSNGCQATTCIKNNTDQKCRVVIRRLLSPSGEILIANILPNGPARYQWSTGANSQQIRVTQPGRYCVTVTAANGCRAETCILVRPRDQSGQCIRGGIRKVLNNDNTATLSFAPEQNSYEYQWSTSESTPSITVDQSGIYYLTVTDPNKEACTSVFRILVQLPSCDAQIFVRQSGSEDLILIVQPGIPNARVDEILWSNGEETNTILVERNSGTYCVTITYHNCTATACINTDSLVRNSDIQLLYDDMGDKYLQVYSDLSIDLAIWNNGDTGLKIIPGDDTVYEVVLMHTDGSYSFAKIDLNPASQKKNEHSTGNSSLSVYPNPIGIEETINVSGLSEGDNDIFIINNSGQILLNKQINVANSFIPQTLEISNLNPGVYFIKVQNLKESKSAKFIKY